MKTMSSKLSPIQIEVLQLMSQGWDLIRTEGFFAYTNLTKVELKKGLKVLLHKDIRVTTLSSLVSKGYIVCYKHNYPSNHYTLTEKGKGYISLVEIIKEISK